jgi:hypothetical protein
MPDPGPIPGSAGGGGAPSGAAGGGLAGTYPNPTLADNTGFMPNPGPDVQGYLSWTNDVHGATASTAALAGGVLNLAMAPWPYTGKALANVDICVNVIATAATAGQCFVAIYSSAGGAALGSAAAETAFGTANLRTIALSIASGSMPSGGPGTVLYVALLFNGTTGPTLARWPNGVPAGIINAQNRTSSSARYGTFGTAQTAVPSLTVGSIASANIAGSFWAGLR